MRVYCSGLNQKPCSMLGIMLCFS